MENVFKNPILPAGDPFVLLHEGKYYLYYTMENDEPWESTDSFHTDVDGEDGIRCWVSEDLVNWEFKGFCLRREDVKGERWFWAPEVTYFNGKFYMIYLADEHMGMAVSESPLGPFVQEEKKWMCEDRCLDGHILLDDDGRNWLYFVRLCGRAGGGNRIFVAPMAEDLSSVDFEKETFLVQAEEAWETKDGLVTEGPFVLKHKGKYYLTYSANHTRSPYYCIGCAVADSPTGPFRKYDRPILEQNDKVAGVGHHSFTTTKDGKTLLCSYHCHRGEGVVKPRMFCLDKAEFVETASGEDKLVIHGPTR